MSWLIDLVELLTKQTLFIAAFTVVLLFTFWVLIKIKRSQKRYSPLTEELLRTPGQQLESELSGLEEKLLAGVLTALLGPVIVLVTTTKSLILWGVALLFFLIGTARTWVVLSKAIRLRLACDGEQYTGAELNLLMRSGAWVFHDIPYSYGNIDHIVISKGGVFAIETKTIRKPEGDRQSRCISTVVFDGKKLKFPHFTTSAPLEQSTRHAKYLKQSISENTGLDIKVTPVVALPGWYIKRTDRSAVWIINPKRGGPLHQAVMKNEISSADLARVANYVETVARSVPASSKKMDPDASKYYDFWNNQKFKPKKIE